MMLRTLGLMAIALLFYSTASHADAADNWKTECVGRYQLSVPGDVDVAFDKLTERGISPHASYEDGQTAVFAKLDYFGYLIVFSPASEKDFANLKQLFSRNRDKAKQHYLDSYSASAQKEGRGYKPLSYDTPAMFGWDGEDSDPGIVHFRDNKIFSYTPPHFTSPESSNAKHFNSFLKDFRTRALFEVPKEQGVCIPYGFIPDDGKQPHEIAVTMRLKDHPDIEVALRDFTGQEPNFAHGWGYLDPKDAINSFFGNSGVIDNNEKVKGSFFGMHSVEMNGQKGGAISVTITRADGSTDYGYVAAVQGSADTPGLLLYVIRTASRAKGKPVSEGELKDMAVKIVASVKRHAVQ